MARIELLPSFVQGVVGSTVFFALYYIFWKLTVGASRRAMIKKYDCKPLKGSADLNSFPNNFIGLKTIRETIKASKEHRLMDNTKNQFSTNGNTYQKRQMFTSFVQTIDPENLKTIMAVNFKDWELSTRRKNTFIPLLGHGIFTTDGAAWHRSRELLRPNFVRSQVGNLDTFETHVSQMLKLIPRDGSTIDLQDLFFQLTIDSATEFLFGESTHCLEGGSSARFADAFNHSQEYIAKSLQRGSNAIWYGSKEFRDDVKYCHGFVDRFVEKGLAYKKTLDLEKADAKSDERYVFLNELVKRTSDPIQIRSELLNILLAGRDTTASLLSDVFFVLARRPEIWAKLRREVDELGGEKPTFQQIKDMKYLRMVLNESLRLYPVVPSNSRKAVVDTVLPMGGGEDGKSPIFVPKNQSVQWSVWAMHRRKDFYGEDAEEFKPERWETLRPGWEYLPFNGGPRICIGQQLALTEASYTTIRLMQEFKSIESRDSRPWTEWITITCAIHNGALVGLTPA